ncbi:hypothetical protein IW140_005022 [Coemansia sp. RSA 1813]|nr:hypothetical protein LPJ74_004568 [Coemansia sp. RSA 1843]KAJ2087224.1 hypothetical protein IW138_005139 [Coemansia sp. RSA 986]KAJ2566209.1 hypothetical protein IW140_005022 [Coemansia sp. RSA 1813]
MVTMMERDNGMVTMLERANGMVTMMEEEHIAPRELVTIEQIATADMQVRAVNKAGSTPTYGNTAAIMEAIAAKDQPNNVQRTSTVTVTMEASVPSVGNTAAIMAAIAAKDYTPTPHQITSTVTVTIKASVPSVGDAEDIIDQIAVNNFDSDSQNVPITLADQDVPGSSGPSVGGQNAKDLSGSGVPCAFYASLAELSITMPSDNCVPGSNSASVDGKVLTNSNNGGMPKFLFSASETSDSDAAEFAYYPVGDEDAVDAEHSTTDPGIVMGSEGFSMGSTFDSSNYKCVVVTTTVWPSP